MDYQYQHFQPTQLEIKKVSPSAKLEDYSADEIEVWYIVSGKGTLTINQKNFLIQTGDMIQLMPYHIRQITESQALEMIQIRFSLGLFLLISTNKVWYLKTLKNLQQIFPIIHLSQRYQEQIFFLCQEILFEKKQSSPQESLLNISFVAFLSHIFTNNHEGAAAEFFDSSWQALQLIQFYHQGDISLERIAGILKIDPEALKMNLKKLTGFTFNQILNQVRIRNATALMQFADLSMNQIGKICGYQSEANFYKQFQLLQKTAPQSYRKKLQQQNQLLESLDAWELASYILENCRRPLLLEEILTQMNYSKEKINQLLEQHFGLHFKTLLNTFRVHIARIFLQSLELSPSEISTMVGFSEYNTFVRNYRKIYQELPTQTAKTNELRGLDYE